MVDPIEYERAKQDAEKLYVKTGSIYSPAFQEAIYFDAAGFNHLVFAKSRFERHRTDQLIRFKLLERGIKLIAQSTTFQEYEIRGHIEYWGLIAIIDNRKIKVVLRRANKGRLYFWSIIPAWKTSKIRDEKIIRTMQGDPERD